MDTEQLALAFSTHDFEVAIPHLADDVVWELVGAGDLNGAEAVAQACRSTAAELDGVAVDLQRTDAFATESHAVVDTVTAYGEGDDRTVVASCDLYTFEGGRIVRIRSYTVEV